MNNVIYLRANEFNQKLTEAKEEDGNFVFLIQYDSNESKHIVSKIKYALNNRITCPIYSVFTDNDNPEELKGMVEVTENMNWLESLPIMYLFRNSKIIREYKGNSIINEFDEIIKRIKTL